MHREIRKLKDGDYPAFLDRLHKAESEFLRSKRVVGKPGEVPLKGPVIIDEDDGTERSLGEIERILKEKPWLT